VERGKQTLEDSHGPSSRAMRKGFSAPSNKIILFIIIMSLE